MSQIFEQMNSPYIFDDSIQGFVSRFFVVLSYSSIRTIETLRHPIWQRLRQQFLPRFHFQSAFDELFELLRRSERVNQGLNLGIGSTETLCSDPQ